MLENYLRSSFCCRRVFTKKLRSVSILNWTHCTLIWSWEVLLVKNFFLLYTTVCFLLYQCMYVRNSFLPYLSLLNISLILRNLTYCIVPLIPYFLTSFRIAFRALPYLLTSYRTYQLCLTLLKNLFPYLPFMIYLTYQPLPNLSSVPYLIY